MSQSNEIPISLEEQKSIEYQLLIKFSEICEANDLRYSLAYGTLLGAIRHKGFIPWDDDIDVMMPRKDYLKFLEISKTELASSPFSIASMYVDDYFAPLSKMYDNRTVVYQHYGQNEGKPRGVYIDIFVADNLPNNNQELFYNKAEKLRGKWALSVRKIFSLHKSRSVIRDVLGSAISVIYKIKGARYYRDKYDSYCSQYADMNTNEIAVVVYGEGLRKERMSIKDFDEYSQVFFEDRFFKAVRDPHHYLSQMYGDYTELPPEDQRVPKHPTTVVRIISE